jgi:cytoskeletal protein CcmA (bactofilin family)
LFFACASNHDAQICLHLQSFEQMAIFNNSKNETTFNPNNLNIINAGTTITGDLQSEGDMRIDGTVKGYIASKARLVLGASAKVDGDIKAVNLELSGEVNGNILVSELLTIKATAKINGDIVSNKLIIEAGATFNGKCSMREAQHAIKSASSSPSESPSAKTVELTGAKNFVS